MGVVAAVVSPDRSRFYNGSEMLHPFGTGLQYNTWSIDSIVTSASQLSASEIEAAHAATPVGAAAPVTGSGSQPPQPPPSVLTVKCVARHTGEFERSSLPVMLYASSPHAGRDGHPLRTLVGFERVAAAKGEQVEVPPSTVRPPAHWMPHTLAGHTAHTSAGACSCDHPLPHATDDRLCMRDAMRCGVAPQVEFKLDAKRLMLADTDGSFHAHLGEWTLEVHASATHRHAVTVVA